MIIGIGIDTIDIRRIQKTIDRFGGRFTNRIFTDTENKKANSRRLKANTYAKRFAAKEAVSKALGTGIAQGVFWRDIGVVNQKGGKPEVVLTGGAKKYLNQITPDGKDSVVHLTITDDYPIAKAFVIIEAV